MNITGYWFADKIALASARAVAIDPVHNPDHLELQRIVENLAITAGLPTPRIYIVQDSSPNAFATGRDKNHAAIAVTSGLLALLDRSELEGVLAHELSHIGNRDILLSTIIVVLVGFVSLASNIFLRSSFLGFGGGRRNNNGEGGNPILAIIGIIFIILSPIVAVIIQLAISRRREFLADATGALITRYPEGLASALEKISQVGANHPLMHASEATAHLYISNPFGAKASKGLAKLFMTHPPTEERIAALRGQQ
ncbi:MAG: M48 family metallopeptidase, partial [Elusimicrobia bacterium]|nr:M48 family metallopeptidase [Elusimicrobiota bacterium]